MIEERVPVGGSQADDGRRRAGGCCQTWLSRPSMSESQEALATAAAPPAGLVDEESATQVENENASSDDQSFSKRLGHFLSHRRFHHIILTLVRLSLL